MKRHVKTFLTSTTAKLAATYLLIIMLMSIGFSVVFYNASLSALHHQVPPDSAFHSQPRPVGDDQQSNTKVREYLKLRAAEGQETLLIRLIILNSGALVLGGAFSVCLARRTLKPIEEAMEAQARFVSDASHELRTPLTAIQTSNEVALRNKKLTLADAKSVISQNTEEAIKLQMLSNGLLNLAKQDKQLPRLQPISVQSVVSDAINHVVALAQAKNISIEDTSEHLQVLSNPNTLQQVLIILLDNAIKYSPAKTTIHVSTASKGSTVWLQVRDEGIGMRASDIPHIFSRFYRADAARNNSSQHGYGLGLAIADALMKHEGAAITVESELTKGSTFAIKLPRAKALKS